MLAQLSTIKARLNLADTDLTYDALLTNAIKSVSGRFDKETNRTLARTSDFRQEFDGAGTEVIAACYPVESVTKFELKTSEAIGWQEVQPAPDYALSRALVISLAVPLAAWRSRAVARVTYTGGYVLPGAIVGAGQSALPDELEQAAVEQVAFWFQNRDRLGVTREWPKGGAYQMLADTDLLPSVREVLRAFRRWNI